MTFYADHNRTTPISIIITLTKQVYSFGLYIQRIFDLKPVHSSWARSFLRRFHKRHLLPPFLSIQCLIPHPPAYVQESFLQVPKLMKVV